MNFSVVFAAPPAPTLKCSTRMRRVSLADLLLRLAFPGPMGPSSGSLPRLSYQAFRMELFVNNGQRESNSAAPSAMLRISIVSGYFNPLHVGHIRMMEAAAELADRLVVIVNNDEQQMMKKGRIITPLDDRLEIVRALRIVDEAVPAIDEDATVKQTLASLRERYPSASLTFANGGGRRTTPAIAPR